LVFFRFWKIEWIPSDFYCYNAATLQEKKMIVVSAKTRSELREFTRVRYAEPVDFSGGSPCCAEGQSAVDLSVGGLRVNVPEFIPVGTVLNVGVCVDGIRAEDIPVTVVWVEKQRFTERYEIGLRFLASDAIVKIKNRIHRFVDDTRNL
jgi:hypothetical protein